MNDAVEVDDANQTDECRRFLDNGRSTADFVRTDGEIFACAECGARLRAVNASKRGQCTKCKFTTSDISSMQYFLKISVVGEQLWAVNAAHLAHLKALVGADLRRHDECKCCRPCRRSVADYAPKWLVLATNREPILKAIATLELKLEKSKN
jgi:hypothetical protein